MNRPVLSSHWGCVVSLRLCHLTEVIVTTSPDLCEGAEMHKLPYPKTYVDRAWEQYLLVALCLQRLLLAKHHLWELINNCSQECFIFSCEHFWQNLKTFPSTICEERSLRRNYFSTNKVLLLSSTIFRDFSPILRTENQENVPVKALFLVQIPYFAIKLFPTGRNSLKNTPAWCAHSSGHTTL